MEFFNKAKPVRLRSHLDKFLVADDDQQTVRQSRNGSSNRARWIVEPVDGNPHAVRLRGCHGRYLCASNEAFLLGMTGKKVLQTLPDSKKDTSIEWEPIKEGYKVKLRTKGGKFLRANGATMPWRNSVTHDLPYRTATQDWVLWDVDVVDTSVLNGQYLPSIASSFNSVQEDFCDSPAQSERDGASWPSISSNKSLPHCSPKQNGMEFFSRAKEVRLQSHLGKYLIADDDQEKVHQSRDGASRNARWTVEYVEGKSHRIRLKSSHGLYLTAADEPYLLGMTGKKVRQTRSEKKTDVSIEWEPLKEGCHVKLMTSEGKFLRANGASPPWRNTVTHDLPHRTATQSWVLWTVDVMEIVISDSESNPDSPHSSCFSAAGDDSSCSPVAPLAAKQGNMSMNKVSAMDMFRKAKIIRLKSYDGKYLTADADEETVIQGRSGEDASAEWMVELIQGMQNVMRLRSCDGKYLTATDEDFLKMGAAGRKVKQSLPRKLDSSVEWEPLRDGMMVKLKTRYGNYLRANGGLPPWRNSITHDTPQAHRDWVLWEVEVVEAREVEICIISSDDEKHEAPIHLRQPSHVSSDSYPGSPKRSKGRLIQYYIADDEGNVHDEYEAHSFQFMGQGVMELTQKLEEETGLENITVCQRNLLNDQLYPLRLSLPPNNGTMHVVVIPSTSRCSITPHPI